MMFQMRGVVAVMMMGVGAAAANAQELDVNPQDYYRSAIAGNPRWGDEHTGEQFCWHARVPAGTFVQGYLATGDRAWLDEAVHYFDTLVDRMDEGADGYKGWIGPYIYDNSVWGDVHVGDAILFDPMLRFSELVLVEEPELAADYGQAAQRYVELAKVHLFEKWDARGTYHQDGPFGAYMSWDHYAQPEDLSAWIHMPERRNTSLSLPFNKNADMASVALRIHRVTGETWYRERAEQIFGYFKSRMQRHGEQYVWNYWEPVGPWDLDPAEPGGLRHWVQVHPHRNYQSGEVSKIVMAYHHGVVFTEADIRAIIHTNLEVMWDGDTSRPRFANANLVVDPGQSREREDTGSGLAGTLWTSLADFSDTVREIEDARRGNGGGGGGGGGNARTRVSRAHEAQVSRVRPAGFERRYAEDDIEVPAAYARFPLGDVAAVRMAVALPMQFDGADGTVLLAKLNQDSELEVAIYDEAGERKMATLFAGEVEGGTDGRTGVHRLDFDAINPDTQEQLAPGAYRIRWTVVGDGYREYPIIVE
ncbi:MAG: hypothetical protein WD009_06180 [Phycisphaeraceae bacterium]